ncbi:hypothetical protein [Neisseria sp.]|uniref:hypothetical protein n=1 Tax=Neisseria sp. TaxID=192066 RepID=UPI00359FAD92
MGLHPPCGLGFRQALSGRMPSENGKRVCGKALPCCVGFGAGLVNGGFGCGTVNRCGLVF